MVRILNLQQVLVGLFLSFQEWMTVLSLKSAGGKPMSISSDC